MSRLFVSIFLLLFTFQVSARAIKNLSFGTDSTLEVMTWNIEHFPKNGQTTIDSVKKVIEALDVDIIAFQEINDKAIFMDLANSLSNYTGFTPENEYNSLAYLYKSSEITNVNIFEIFTNSWHEFPRAPLVIEFGYNNEKIFVINNHFKCCGDGVLKKNSYYDEENRRYEASKLLEEYIQNNLSKEKVFVVGDLNDNVTDKESNNVFTHFLNKPDDYLFANIEIAEGKDTHWSFPWYPSHIDHIIITNELFEAFSDSISEIQTIRIDKEMKEGMYEYDEKISDHRPVAIKLNTKKLATSTKIIASNFEFMIFPNPVQNMGYFSFQATNSKSEIKIFNSTGIEIDLLKIAPGKSEIKWNTSNQIPGIYFASLFIEGQKASTIKFIIVE